MLRYLVQNWQEITTGIMYKSDLLNDHIQREHDSLKKNYPLFHH